MLVVVAVAAAIAACRCVLLHVGVGAAVDVVLMFLIVGCCRFGVVVVRCNCCLLTLVAAVRCLLLSVVDVG